METIRDILDNMDKFVPTDEQLSAIQNRNYAQASDLGVTLDQYLYYVSPKYRWKLSFLI